MVCKVAISPSVDKNVVVKALNFLINKLETDNNYVDVLSLAFEFKEWIDEMADCINSMNAKCVYVYMHTQPITPFMHGLHIACKNV